MRKAFVSLALVMVLGIVTRPLGAWGRQGHHIVALIAEKHISAETKAAV